MWEPASAGHGVSTPVEVTGARGALQLAAGQDFTCALRADGRVLCWGANDQGQLGDGTRARRPEAHVPASVVNLDDAVEVAAGRYFSCARRRSHAGRGGRVVCWGANNSGQLGDRSKTARTRPVLVAGLEDAVQLAAGRGHACALRLTADGKSPIVCWGSHEAGVRGAGNTKTSELGLTTVASATRLLSLTSGDLHLCARHTDGVACWGRNSSGQLGDGTGYDRLTPVSTGGAWE
jgi:alpha-tubulin suppressor-like RCC1 family protein